MARTRQMRKMLYACANRLRRQSSVAPQAVTSADSIVVIAHAKVPLVKFELHCSSGVKSQVRQPSPPAPTPTRRREKSELLRRNYLRLGGAERATNQIEQTSSPIRKSLHPASNSQLKPEDLNRRSNCDVVCSEPQVDLSLGLAGQAKTGLHAADWARQQARTPSSLRLHLASRLRRERESDDRSLCVVDERIGDTCLPGIPLGVPVEARDGPS